MTNAKTIQANRQRVTAARKLHEEREKERADKASTIKAAYQAQADSIVVKDFLEKCQQFISYHQKLAQDGQGARKTGYKLENGTDEVENYFLGSTERLAHLDKAAGIQEMLDYVERKLAVDTTPVITESSTEAK